MHKRQTSLLRADYELQVKVLDECSRLPKYALYTHAQLASHAEHTLTFLKIKLFFHEVAVTHLK